MEVFKMKACSPPACGCPTLTIEESIDGIQSVVVEDDYNGIVVMTIEEFNMLALGFLNAQKTRARK